MQDHPIDFPITALGKASIAFRALGARSFVEAALYIQHLPYARNASKHDPLTVLTDGCGTCSSKHALLKILADENGQHAIQLMIGLFRMSGRNTPAVSATLKHHRLHHIPEAHCYLKYAGVIMDHTRTGSSAADFSDDLIEEQAITPAQITDYKVRYQQAFIAGWLPGIGRPDLTFEQLWLIREQCILDIANASGKRKTTAWKTH